MVYMRVNCDVRGTCNKKGPDGTCTKCGRRPKGGTWWFRFRFGGRMVHESTRSRSKTVALQAERERRRQLEESWNGIKRRTLPPTFNKASAAWLKLKRPHLAPRSVAIEEQNLKHLRPVFGPMLISDITAQNVSRYQQSRLSDNSSPKTINLEICTLRAILRRYRLWQNLQLDVKMLPTREDFGQAITHDQETKLRATRVVHGRSILPLYWRFQPRCATRKFAYSSGSRLTSLASVRGWAQAKRNTVKAGRFR